MIREEQARLEEIWTASARTYDEDRRREIYNLWIDYHSGLARVFRGYANHHARQQERYQRILAEESEDAE